MAFRKVRSVSQSDDGAIKIELFRDEQGRVCGWFLGPVRMDASGVSIPYLRRSEGALASLAIIRAIEAAANAKLPLWIVDPHDLWDRAWQT